MTVWEYFEGDYNIDGRKDFHVKKIEDARLEKGGGGYNTHHSLTSGAQKETPLFSAVKLSLMVSLESNCYCCIF